MNVHQARSGGWIVSVGVSELGHETAIKVWSSNAGKPSDEDAQSTVDVEDEHTDNVSCVFSTSC